MQISNKKEIVLSVEDVQNILFDYLTKEHESHAGYGEDYTDGRIVGGASLARRILEILKSVPW